MYDLSKVTIFIKSFLRHGLLAECLDGIACNLPECEVLIVDDSFEKTTSTDKITDPYGNTVLYMPFDSGFGAKSNEMTAHLTTPYVLIGSDDFDFDADGCQSVIKMLLEENPEFSIASGRVNGNPYESMFQFGYASGDRVREIPGHYGEFRSHPSGLAYCPTDLTVNFSLIRSSILGFGPKQVHWDSDVKIGGGEHGAFFLDVYWAGHRVCYVPGANINEIPADPRKVDPRYASFRQRASQPGRICLARRGIKHYGLADGSWEDSCI